MRANAYNNVRRWTRDLRYQNFITLYSLMTLRTSSHWMCVLLNPLFRSLQFISNA